jgi:hypothetical protein
MKWNAHTFVLASLSMITATSLACTLSLIQLPNIPGGPTQPPIPIGPAPTSMPRAQTTFTATLPEALAGGESLTLDLLDEVTGLSFNSQSYPMLARDNLTYTTTIALPLNAVVKYRYVRRGSSQILEQTAVGGPIRYRLYYVAGQGEVNDIVANWSDKTVSHPTGNIQGRVINIDTDTPVPDILVTAAGAQAFSDSAGRFDLQGIQAGTHLLVAYSLDGTYKTFEQGAAVAQNLTTAVEIRVRAASLVHVTFNVTAPKDVQGAPIRIAGNLLELGNTFADLKGGLSTVADRMPVMTLQPDGSYSLTLSLPTGADLQYKYSLGDGFWNAEHRADGGFQLRELIVPSQDLVVQDSIETWQAGTSAPILFEVAVPATTPSGDLIYIQFNPYGWTEPIPMWPLGNNRWVYKLYGPLNMLGTFHYRFCRNGQCGSADDLSTAGNSAQGRQIETSLTGQDIQDTVTSWAWLDQTEPTTLVGSAITVRQPGFVSGVEFQSTFQPNWSYYNPAAIQNVKAIGANWVVLTPSWTYQQTSPLEFGLFPGHDPFWFDSAIMVSQARTLNLNVGLFPTPHFSGPAADFWRQAPRGADWWQIWFDHYRAFAVNYADLAAQTGSQALILGGDWLGPALPQGTMTDGSPSGVPADADARWQAIITEVRQHYKGNLLWALPYTRGKIQLSLNFLKSTDGIYLLWNAPLATQAGASKTDMANQAGQLLDNEVSPLPSILNKPITLALAYPSAVGSATGCLNDGGGGCLDWKALNQPYSINSVALDLAGQENIYEAMLIAINTRPWVGGLVSRGYYLPAALQDKSASIHGKPAADLLWYWFPRLTGLVK